MSVFKKKILDAISHMKLSINKSNAYSNKSVKDIVTTLDIPVQFVTGYVQDCITDANSQAIFGTFKKESGLKLQYNSQNLMHQNCIKAVAHPIEGIQDLSKSEFEKFLDSRIYKPLLRGVCDAPVRGDCVLLCEFGGQPYYLGPLNTFNNVNLNPDLKFNPGVNTEEILNQGENIDTSLGKGILEKIGIPKTFELSSKVPRLRKSVTSLTDSSLIGQGGGDLVFEGRHGNSIRLGSKSKVPCTILSNGRFIGSTSETLLDTSLIFMSHYGSLEEWFKELDNKKDSAWTIYNGFDLSSNKGKVFEDSRSMVFDDTNYNGSQILIRSQKLIFDARGNNFFLSSGKNLNLSAADQIDIMSMNTTYINAEEVYLGDSIGWNGIGKGKDAEHVAMADSLIDILTRLIDNIGLMNVGGVMPNGFSTPLSSGNTPGWSNISALKGELANIKSNYCIVQRQTGKKAKNRKTNNDVKL